jgi:hypothetical protein
MSKTAKTPKSRADTRLSNLVFEGGKSKQYRPASKGVPKSAKSKDGKQK